MVLLLYWFTVVSFIDLKPFIVCFGFVVVVVDVVTMLLVLPFTLPFTVKFELFFAVFVTDTAAADVVVVAAVSAAVVKSFAPATDVWNVDTFG